MGKLSHPKLTNEMMAVRRRDFGWFTEWTSILLRLSLSSSSDSSHRRR